MQVEFLGTYETILETLRAEGVEVEEITIPGLDAFGDLYPVGG